MLSAVRFRREGDAGRDNKDWSTAASSYYHYLKLVPDDADIWVQFGHVSKEQGKLQDAEEAYRRAASLNPGDADVRIHLAHLLKRRDQPKMAASIFQDVLKICPSAEVIDELKLLGYGNQALAQISKLPASTTKNGRYFELKDLFQYLSQHQTVTGITRVVLSLVNFILEELDEADAKAYFFVHQFGDGEALVLLPKPKLRQLIRLAKDPDAGHQPMIDIIADIRRTAPMIKLNAGDLYFIPGAFWEFVANPSWLMSMKQNGVYIGVYIYDLIPITHSHYCMATLTDAFNSAFSETARLFDCALTISEFVASEVNSFLASHLIPAFPTFPVPLAHELNFDSVKPLPKPVPGDAIQVLEGRAFVLCVCTIEARKNHGYLFYIWQQMIDAGIDVPDLVFVGRHGWRVQDLLSQIDASRNLDGQLHIMNGLSDSDLTLLYERCMFTVFPSFVEGWGLPVGESLAHGKVCVASSTSSIPEVGGEFAVYIDPFDLHSGYRAIHRLITEPAYLAKLETHIRKNFVARTWNDVGRDFFERLDGAMSGLTFPRPASAVFAPRIKAGELIEMSWLVRAGLRRSEYAGNPVRLLLAQGWRSLEETGTWLLGNAGRLRLHTDYESGRDISILLQVGTSPWVSEKNTLRVWATDKPANRIEADSSVCYVRPTRSNRTFWIRLKATVAADATVMIQFQVDGAVEASEPPTIPVSIRLHSFGFAATDDCQLRMNLLEQASLVTC
jgi:glycosyltransferase involved in cell wall biosynthesis